MQCKKCKKECMENELTNGICADCLIENNKGTVNTNSNANAIGCLVAFIFIGAICFFIWNGIGSIFNDTKTDDNSGTPSNIELMSYAQTVLDDNLSNPKYSSNKNDYNFVKTGLRYKIEGKVNNEKFWLIIQFTDDTYKEYDLISLQIGNKTIK